MEGKMEEQAEQAEQKPLITVADVWRVVKQKAADNPEYSVYDGGDGTTCVYFEGQEGNYNKARENGEPVCLVGHMLAAAGATWEMFADGGNGSALRSWDSPRGLADAAVKHAAAMFEPDALLLAISAQSIQDSGTQWGRVPEQLAARGYQEPEVVH